MARPVFYTPIKRSHLIAPFGVGAVLLARNGVSVVVCGLDEWLNARPDHPRGVGHWLEENRVADRNLEARLGVTRLVRPPPSPMTRTTTTRGSCEWPASPRGSTASIRSADG